MVLVFKTTKNTKKVFSETLICSLNLVFFKKTKKKNPETKHVFLVLFVF